MPNVVIDASTVVSAAIRGKSPPYRAVALARRHGTVCMSDAVERELREVLARPKLKRHIRGSRARRLIGVLLAKALRVKPEERVEDCRDAKDNKYLELALAAAAAVVISSDKDLLDLDPWRGIRIVTPGEYVAMVEGRR